MRKFIPVHTLYFLNGVHYIKSGKVVRQSTYNFAKLIATQGIEIQFRTEEGEIISLSSNKDDKWYYNNLFREKKSFRLE